MTQQENRGLFLMLPDCLLDDTRLTETAIIGFARLMRYCQQQRTSAFHGSFSKLARIMKLSKTTAFRIVQSWIECGLVTKEADLDYEMVLELQQEDLWQYNKDYCAEKYPHSVSNWNGNIPPQRSNLELSNSKKEQDRSKMKPDNSRKERIVPLASTKQDTKNIRISKKEEGEEENTPPEIPSTEKTDDTPESQNPFQVPVSEKKTPPAWIKHLPTVRSTQYKMPDKLFVQPPKEEQGQVPEPRPLTRNEQQYLNEQERNAIWKVIEEVFHTSFTYGVRTHILNTRGMDGLIADHFTPDDVRKALTNMEAFHRNNLKANFTLEKLHLKMPGLLAAKESPPVVYPSRPIETIPPPTGGGWGRRLDSGAGIGMMPGVGRVRHD